VGFALFNRKAHSQIVLLTVGVNVREAVPYSQIISELTSRTLNATAPAYLAPTRVCTRARLSRFGAVRSERHLEGRDHELKESLIVDRSLSAALRVTIVFRPAVPAL
jgi:hypothetical protein